MPDSPAEIARSPAAWERLAKDWLVELIERTPLGDVEAVPLAQIAAEAPDLIAEILGQVSDPGAARDLELPPAARERAASLASGRDAEAAAPAIARELAALQALLVEALGREIGERERGEYTRSVSRLAEIFGAVQSAAVETLIRESAPAATAAEPAGGLPGVGELGDWLRILFAEQRAGGEPFALAHIDVEGIERIAAAHGGDGAERMVDAVANVVEGQTGRGRHAFRVGPGQMILLDASNGARGLLPAVERLAEVVESSQGESGPRVTVRIGVAACPDHAADPDGLIDAAEQAAWSAAAAGQPVAIAAGTLQDP